MDFMMFVDLKLVEQVKFYICQYINFVVLMNYLFFNLEVCEEILKSKGQSMLKGIENFMWDLEYSLLEVFKIM